MKRFIIIIILLLSCISGLPINKKDRHQIREIVTQLGDTIIRANILTDGIKIKTSETRLYYWYSNGNISFNYGGYAGKLLHLDYLAFLNDKLIETGSFDQGLKQGKWTSWYENGVIRKTCTYKNGIQDGKYYFYDEEGNIKSKGKYRNGKNHPRYSISDLFKNKTNRNKIKKSKNEN